MPISKLIPSCTSKHQRKLKKNVYGKTWAQLIPCKIFSDTLKSRRFLIWSRKKNHKRTMDFDIECIYKCDRCCAFAVESSWLCLGFFFFPVLIFFEILFNIAKPEWKCNSKSKNFCDFCLASTMSEIHHLSTTKLRMHREWRMHREKRSALGIWL